MQWQELKPNFLLATVDSGESIDAAMTELCQQINNVVIPKNTEIDWDYLRVELWPDTGRIIVFPARLSNLERIEKAACQVVFNDLLADYEDLADSQLSDDAFDHALIQEEKKWIESFLNCARKSKLVGNRVQFWEGTGSALSDVESQFRAVPALRFDNPNGLNFVRFDGFRRLDNGVIELIDAKTRLLEIPARSGPFIPESVAQRLRNQSAAIAQNPEFRAVLEFPNEAARREGQRILRDLGITNIQTRVR